MAKPENDENATSDSDGMRKAATVAHTETFDAACWCAEWHGGGAEEDSGAEPE